MDSCIIVVQFCRFLSLSQTQNPTYAQNAPRGGLSFWRRDARLRGSLVRFLARGRCGRWDRTEHYQTDQTKKPQFGGARDNRAQNVNFSYQHWQEISPFSRRNPRYFAAIFHDNHRFALISDFMSSMDLGHGPAFCCSDGSLDLAANAASLLGYTPATTTYQRFPARSPRYR